MTTPLHGVEKKAWLPKFGSWKYHALMILVAAVILGPLGGIAAAYMNFSLGFFVGGQVLAGILGSSVTFGYGAEGRHGANYMQTLAASVASMGGMAVLIQAMVWLGLPEPPVWQLVLYFLCIGMFGVGVGMLYTPILVDNLQLTFPSGLAVANILRALTDRRLLRRSLARLGGGTALGLVGGVAAAKIAALEVIGVSTSTLGAGMVVGARIGIPAIVGGLVSWSLTDYFRSIGWLGAEDPFRKITFIIALGMIMGAAIIDLSIIGWKAAQRIRERRTVPARPEEDWKASRPKRLVAWVIFWGAGIVIVGSSVLHVPMWFLVFAVLLVFVFSLVNGISLGITDSNPISSAFVVSVLLMVALGLRDAGVGLMAASILLIATAVGCDMQQDRSTGWRLGTNRIVQFRYQVLGITMGAILAVVMAKVFMGAYPVLEVNAVAHPEQADPRWQAAMTYKFVGALSSITHPQAHTYTALYIGLGIGFVTELLRKLIKANAAYKANVEASRSWKVADFVVDAVVLPSPYASSFGGFVNLGTSLWFGGGGVLSSVLNSLPKKKAAKEDDVPEDMSTTSLVGGGLIAGDSLAALLLGIAGLLTTFFGG